VTSAEVARVMSASTARQASPLSSSSGLSASQSRMLRRILSLIIWYAATAEFDSNRCSPVIA
jgi:hypothetical protein